MTSKTWSLAFGALMCAVAAYGYADAGKELLLSGPVEQLDRGTSTVTVLGQKFKASTEQLSVGEVVNVYGVIAGDGSITDPLVQATDTFGTNGDAVFLKGLVTASDPALGRMQINGVTIDYTPELGNSDFSTPSVGDVVALAGTQPANKGVLVVSTTGPAAYSVGAPATGMAAPAGMTGSGPRAMRAETAGMTGSGPRAVRPETAGMTGSGPRAMRAAGMTGSGPRAMRADTAGMTGSGPRVKIAGMTGSGPR